MPHLTGSHLPTFDPYPFAHVPVQMSFNINFPTSDVSQLATFDRNSVYYLSQLAILMLEYK